MTSLVKLDLSSDQWVVWEHAGEVLRTTWMWTIIQDLHSRPVGLHSVECMAVWVECLEECPEHALADRTRHDGEILHLPQ
jgi:NAD-dependent dihydropyrimidine dehydrogenase PreA subunit